MPATGHPPPPLAASSPSPKRLRAYGLYRRRLLGEMARVAARTGTGSSPTAAPAIRDLCVSWPVLLYDSHALTVSPSGRARSLPSAAAATQIG
jgi:hypothetical protein